MPPRKNQALEPVTDRLRRSPVWLKILVWVVGFLATVSLAVGGWAHGTLWGHEQRICRTENEVKNIKEANKLDHERILKSLDRLDGKLDKILFAPRSSDTP